MTGITVSQNDNGGIFGGGAAAGGQFGGKNHV
jgi:hypothetical protein